MEDPSEPNSSLFANLQTKERSVNFSTIEIDRLKRLVDKYKHVLLCKRTDASSTRQKENAWNLLQKDFNAVGETPRTVKQLKYKFDNMKRSAKKDASRERQEMRRTGGGPPPAPPALDDTTDWLRSIMSTTIDGIEAIYDDDVIAPKFVVPPKIDQKIIIETINKTSDKVDPAISEGAVEIEGCTDDTPSTSEKWAFDTSTPYSFLKRPASSPLKRLAKKKLQKNYEAIVNTRQNLREKKIAVLDGTLELELKKLQESIAQQKEIHEQILKFNEERHQLEIEKFKLEILILKDKRDEINKMNK